LLKKGEVQGSQFEAREAVRIAPNNAEAYRTLGRAMSFSGDVERATTALRKAVELDPQRWDLHDDLGALLGQQSKLGEAAEQFLEALETATEVLRRHVASGVVPLPAELADDAAILLRDASELAPPRMRNLTTTSDEFLKVKTKETRRSST
jgi:Flp pilus assembly protein TadD